MPDRPRIRVNQAGYLPDAPKQATWVTAAPDPAAFTVTGPDDRCVLRGRSEPWPERPEPSSGLSVHVIDLSTLPPGDGYRLRAGTDHSHPFAVASDVYARLSRDALRLFYLLRSGCPIDEERAPGYGRPAGHTGDVAVAGWAEGYPGWQPTGTFDVSGGWYDAGDYGKYVTSGSIALWQLLHLVRFTRGRRVRWHEELVEECRWQLDWMLRMQVPAGQPYAGMAFHRVHGSVWSPMPGLAHDDPTTRVLHRPSTAATLHLAAVAAQGARLFQEQDPAYAESLLAAAHLARRAAAAHPDLLAPDDQGKFGGGPYNDAELDDDFHWADVNLGHTTEPINGYDPAGFDGDAVTVPACLDLALSGNDKATELVVAAADRLIALQREQPWGQPYHPPEGWAWGSNGRILNNLVVLTAAHERTGERRFRDATATGMDYLLGRNALGQCYVTGYGTDATAHLRTRQFGHDLDPSLPPPPPGVLAGGANSVYSPGFPSDPRIAGLPPQQCYLDVPTSETTNDMCIRWNAPLAYVTAYLTLT